MESSTITYNIADKEYKYVEFDYGIKDSVRENTTDGQNEKVKVIVYADGTKIYEGNELGWKTVYESVLVKIPEGTSTIKIESKPLGSKNNHAGICDLRFIGDDESNDFEEAEITNMPENIVANIGEEVNITPTVIESDGIDEYQWYKDGNKIEGKTEATLTLEL